MLNDISLRRGLYQFAHHYPNLSDQVMIYSNILEYFACPNLQKILTEEYGIKAKIETKVNERGQIIRRLGYEISDEEKALKFKLMWCGD